MKDGKAAKLSLRQKLERACHKIRKKRVEKSIKEDAHTMNDVCGYMVNELGYIEVDKSEVRYKEEYREMREGDDVYRALKISIWKG